MVWSDTIFVMILSHDKWKSFTDRPIADVEDSRISLALALGSRDAVDAMVGQPRPPAAPPTSTRCRIMASCTVATFWIPTVMSGALLDGSAVANGEPPCEVSS
jgi:hypothetical protein